ncbi:MAG TPA: o-succinylbenzoate synthase [Gemmatimonadales bacterium]|jgi:O-succinylbenzoate synthase|nr:o-succinylbenzoate synthase [Gemmatimonadales bacterium]
MTRIDRAELLELTLPLVEPFVISGGTIAERRSLIVVLHDDAGHVGYGECPPFHLPFYSEETLAGARDLIGRVLLPRVIGREFGGPLPEAIDALLREGVRGNWFARAGVETAAWDLEANARATGLAALLGERLGVAPAGAVECGVALGIPPDRRADILTKWVYEAVQRGYRRVKIKVAPGWDVAAVAAARQGMAGTTLPLTVDANGAYEWPRDEQALRGLDEAGLLYIEQPLHPDELVGHARLSEKLRTPICLDETLRDARAARQIMTLNGPKVWNIKVHRVGGLGEVCRIYRLAAEYGAKLWAGTMPESGIGSQAALAAAALPLFVYPSDLEPSSRWFGRNGDVIKLSMGKDGRMAVPNQSCGRLLDPARFRLLTAPVLLGRDEQTDH